MRKLKYSVKFLQESITSLKQAGPFCVQEAKTHSFRAGEPAVRMKDLPTSSSLSTSSSSSSSSSSISQHKEGRIRISPKRFFFSPKNTNSIMEDVKEMETGDDVLSVASSFYKESEALAMGSLDPYRDFKLSMSEMVRAHGIKGWVNLRELLHCYLRLNDGKNHKFIVLAFVDLVMQLIAEDRNIFGCSSADPLCLSVCDFIE